MKAEILYTVGGDAVQELAGTFILDDGKIDIRVADPKYDLLMHNVFNRPIGQTGLTAKDEPEAWLRYLPTAYDGTMVRARFVGPKTKAIAIAKE